jgi:cation:H+ antiporter
VRAVLSGHDGIALGNIIGSNIANIFLVLGLPAVIYPIATHIAGLRRHALIMLIATAAFAATAYFVGYINTAIGTGLFAGILVYAAYIWIRARQGGAEPVIDEVEEYLETSTLSLKTILFLAAGLAGLPFGAHLLVHNGAALAAAMGVREEVVGLTIVAFGTSLPEFATVIAAALHKKSDVAIGGVIGSNIFNLLAVGGAAGLAGTAQFSGTSLVVDLPVMILAALAVSAFVFTRRQIGRLTGLSFFAAYALFIIALASFSGGM